MTFIDNILKNRVLAHVLFWLVMLVFSSQVFFYGGQNFVNSLLSILVLVPSMLIAAYTLVYYQVPKLIFKRKYLKFIISFLIVAYCTTVLARLLTVFVAEPIRGVVELTPKKEMLIRIFTSVWRLVQGYMLSIYIIPIVMLGIKLIKQRSEEKQKVERLEKEKATTELNFLKAQIHPHFLLNTLNNIYALSLKKSDKTSESVLKLSEMLTYVLYKCNEKFVALKDEIQLIENYIALEKLRYGNNLKIEFNKGQIDESLKMAPLILLSVVENAFKHGVSGDIGNPEVIIDLSSKNDELYFTVFNTKNKNKQADYTDYTKGIGSKNVKKQLNLVYPNAHSFVIDEKAESYSVELILKTKTNG